MGIKLIDKINAEQTAKFAEKKFPEFRTGDIVRVSIKIKEGDKFRVQDFEGKVFSIDNGPRREALPLQQPLDPGDQGRQEGRHSPCQALQRAHLLLAQGRPQARQEVRFLGLKPTVDGWKARPPLSGRPSFLL